MQASSGNRGAVAHGEGPGGVGHGGKDRGDAGHGGKDREDAGHGEGPGGVGQGKRPGGVDHGRRPCPIGRAGDLLGDRWTLLILRDATAGITRFDDFKENLGIADNILATRLRRLVESGVLVKVPYRDGNRTRHEYRLTQAGADLLPVLRALADWGTRYTEPAPKVAPMRMLHADCGGEVNVAGVCGTCGQIVPRQDEAWLRPWRSAEPTPLALPVG